MEEDNEDERGNPVVVGRAVDATAVVVAIVVVFVVVAVVIEVVKSGVVNEDDGVGCWDGLLIGVLKDVAMDPVLLSVAADEEIVSKELELVVNEVVDVL